MSAALRHGSLTRLDWMSEEQVLGCLVSFGLRLTSPALQVLYKGHFR